MRGFVAAALALSLAISASAEEKKEPAKMLMITQSISFKHGPVTRPEGDLSPAEIAVKQLGEQSELFTVDCSQDAARDFTKENLENYDLVFFYTQGNVPIAKEHLEYFCEKWLTQKGHGLIATHSSTDTLVEEKLYWDMIGGSFDGHPWNAGETVTITVHDQKHPGTKPFGEEFQIKDEIYQYKNWQPEKVRVLMSLNMEKTETKRPYHVPVSWVKEYGEGRIFYTNLGHNTETWTNKTFIKSLEGGVRWVRGLEEGSAEPNPELSKAETEKAKKAAGE